LTRDVQPGEHGRLIGSIFPLLFFLLLFVSAGFAGQPPATDAAYLDRLLALAARKQLHRDPYWHTLLHYRKGWFGSRSLVDDPDFFLAPDGKYDPQAELTATLRAFFQAEEPGRKHAVCRFAARFTWLREQLAIDPGRLPVPECRQFEELYRQLKPVSVSLIFPAAHMNGPASMYGHTLLVIDNASKSKPLAHAVNYAAFTTETFGPLYAVKGLFGFYDGYFSMLPYYAKLQEYNDVGSRDIWEYPLNLNAEEIRRLLLHLYELDYIRSDYYFFDENCSYMLLFLLDAARPGLDLTDQYDLWVIPVDTIRAVQDKGVTTGEVIYRPSLATRIKHIASLLSEDDRRYALAVARGEIEADRILEQDLPPEKKRQIIDLSGEYLQYLNSNGKIGPEDYRKRFLKTLTVRSRLSAGEEDRYEIPVPERPETGHLSSRLAVGGGTRGGDAFTEVEIRPVLQGLLDNDKGFLKGAQIILGGTSVRYFTGSEELKLWNMDLIDIVSISPRDEFFPSVSWKINTGLYRRPLDRDRDSLLYRVNPGGGFAFQNGAFGLWYLFLETDLNLGPDLDYNAAAGIGGSAGVLFDITEFWKAVFSARDIYYGLGDTTNYFKFSLMQNWTLTTNTAIAGDIAVEDSQAGKKIYEYGIRFNLYF
jgi:Domain of unknown function (DUF4105)